MAALLLSTEHPTPGPSRPHLNLVHTPLMDTSRRPLSSRMEPTSATLAATSRADLAALSRPTAGFATSTATPALQSRTYLTGPLRTLRASTESSTAANITDTDLAEAYVLLAERTEACSEALSLEGSDGDSSGGGVVSYPALQGAREILPSNTLCTSLRRDVGRALTSAELGPGQTKLTAVQKVRSYNNTRVCRAALRFLAAVLHFPLLQRTLFKLHELALLTKYVSDLVIAPTLPMPGEKTIYAAALSALAEARASPTAIRRFVPDIIKGLERFATGASCDGRAVDTEGGTGEWSPRAACLRASASLLRQYPTLFLSPVNEGPIARLLAAVLRNLVCGEEPYRDLAARVIVSYANAVQSVFHGPEAEGGEEQRRDDVRSGIANTTVEWLDEQDKDARARRKDAYVGKNKFIFADYVPTLADAENSSSYEMATVRALVLSGALAFLAGPRLFGVPGALRTVVKCIENAGSSQVGTDARRDGANAKMTKKILNLKRSLRSGAWCCLVFTWAQMGRPLWSVEGESVEDRLNRRRKAWMLVKQEQRGDAGIALVATLLNNSRGRGFLHSDILEMAKLIKEMAGGSSSGRGKRTAQSMLLALLVPSADTCATKTAESIFPSWLFDQSLFSSSSSPCLPPNLDIRSTFEPLSDDQMNVEGVWPELVSAFVKMVDGSGNGRVDDDIITIWTALVRVGASFAQKSINVVIADDSNTAAQLDRTVGPSSRSRPRSAMSIIADALIILLRTPSPPFASPGAGALKVVRRLWECARSTIESSSLAPSSPRTSNSTAGPSNFNAYGKDLAQSVMEPILKVLLSKHAHEPSRPAVAALARSLASADIKKALGIALDVLGSRPAALCVIWVDWAQTVALGTDTCHNYDDGDALVAFAIRNAYLLGLRDEQNSVQFERVVALCVSILESTPSETMSKSRIALKEFRDARREGADSDERLILFSVRLCAAVLKKTAVRPTCEEELLTLDVANLMLLRAYEKSDKNSNLSIDTFKMLVEPLSSLVRSWPAGDGDLLIKYLEHLEPGLQIWFADEAERIDDDIYNSDIIPFYAAVLDVLSSFPTLAPKVLDVLGSLLTSPCSRPRIAPPAGGPVALRGYLDSHDVWSELECATLERGWRVPEGVRDVACTIGETWGWANKGVRGEPTWAQSLPGKVMVEEKTVGDANAVDSQRSDESIVPPSVEDEASPDPFSMLESLSSPKLYQVKKGKERAPATVSNVGDEGEGDDQEDGLATPKARPRVLGLDFIPDSEDRLRLNEDADVPNLPLAPLSPTSVANDYVDRGRLGRNCDWSSVGNGHRQASAELGRAHKRRRVRNRSAVRISPSGAPVMVFDGVELSPMRPTERVRYLSVTAADAGEGCSRDGVGNEDVHIRAEAAKVNVKGAGGTRSHRSLEKGRSQTAPVVESTILSPSPRIVPSLSSSAPESPTSPVHRSHTTPHSQLQRLARLETLRGAYKNAGKTSDSQSQSDVNGRERASEDEMQTQDLALVQEYLHDMQGVLNEELRRRFRLGTRTGRAGVGKS